MTDQNMPPRKKVKHFHERGHLHELTFSCFHRLPLLTNDGWRQMLSTSIEQALAKHHFGLTAFVFMPEHVHLIVQPLGDFASISDLLKAIKQPFSSRIKDLLKDSASPLMKKLTVHQRPSVTTFRFWQEGSGYDRNLTEVSTTLAAIDYVHLNPVRRGLVKQAIDWKWSSARVYTGDAESNPHLPPLTRLPAEWLDST
jgi:putative transposase